MRIPPLYLLIVLLFTAHLAAADEQTAISQPQHVLVMGDSLSAGYGIEEQQGWVVLLKQHYATKQNVADTRPNVTVTNASVSGETSSGGLARLPALLAKHQPTLVILELGGNDGLRGLPLKLLRSNLQAMIDLCTEANAQVILAGMQIPPNYGARYASQFKALYPELAAKNTQPLIPFLLDGIAGRTDLIQPDGIHPTAEAQPIILANVLGVMEGFIIAEANNAKSPE
ncbi:MAG: arylesterase [Marinagarivorans sp.]|nr:arylesterase [Marinagarivorans sp.]